MRWALLLEAEDLATAGEIAKSLQVEDDEDPETLRLLAHQALCEGKFAEARAFADAAAGIAPDWLGVIRVGAIVRYAQAITPLAPLEFSIQPNPIDPILVRDDVESLAGLRQAYAAFERLASRSHAERGDKIWRLACLANLPEGQPLAAEAAATFLANDPMDVAAVAWAVSRQMPLDLGPSRLALTEAYSEGRADAFGVRALAHLLLLAEGPRTTLDTLRAHLGRQAGEADQEAASWVERLTGAVETPGGPVFEAPELATRLADEFHGNPGPAALILAQAAAQADRFDLLAPYADELERFDTAAAINVALYTRFRADEPEAALALIARHRQRFPAWAADPAVRRIEVRATAELRRLPEALRLAELLAAETGILGDRLVLADLHLSSGHAQAALPAIRAGLDGGNLDALTAIRFSFATTREDRELARALWRHAQARGLPDDLLVVALGQAHRLGLEEEAGSLMPRIHARAQSGANDVWLVEIPDIVETLLDYGKRNSDISELYELGVLPVHLAATTLNLKLAEFYWLDGRAESRTALKPLLIRNGGRPVDLKPDLPWREWTLHIDVTGLLIADQIGLMSYVENLSIPVFVSPILPQILYDLEQEVTHHQLARVEVAHAISKAHLGRRLLVQTTTAGEAELVRHERHRREACEPGPTVDSVARRLAELGELGSGGLPRADPDDLGSMPPLSGRLVFPENTLEALALRGLLEPLLRTFTCEIPQVDLDDLHQEILRAEAGESLADRVGALRLRVGRLIESGRFVFCPQHDEPEADLSSGAESRDVPATETRSRPPLEQGLIDLITAPAVQGGVLWCDDRNLSGYVQAGGNLIMGVVEVMNALVADGHMTDAERRRKLLQLRAGGAAFLPLRLDEVLEPLLEAPLDPERGLIETADLAILRRNLATACSLDPRMKMGQVADPRLQNRPDEFPFLGNARQLLLGVLNALWGNPGLSLDECRARADWVWREMRLEQTFRKLRKGGRADLAILQVASLYTGAMHVDSKGRAKDREARRRHLVDWITLRAVKPRAEAGDQAFLDGLAKRIAQLASAGDAEAFASGRPAEEVGAVLAALRQRLYDTLPEALQERLLGNRAFAAAAGYGVRQVLTTAGVRFPAAAFWAACGRALRSGSARMRTLDGGTVTFSRDSAESLDMRGAASSRLSHGVFPVLAAEGAARVEVLERYLAAYDLGPGDLERVRRRAMKARTDATLAEALDEAQVRSAAARYDRLELALRRRQNVLPTEFLPPPTAQLKHYLRIGDEHENPGEAAARAWAGLRASLGARTAFMRLCGLPVPLGVAIANDLRAASLDLEDLGPPVTPLMRLHRAAVARALGDDVTVRGDLEEVLSSVSTDGVLLPALVRWTEAAFHADAEWRALPVSHQLALVWGHAHQIAAIFLSLGYEPTSAAKYFREHPPAQDLAGLLFLSNELRADAAAPATADGARIAYHGLAYVAGDDEISAVLPSMDERLIELRYQSDERTLPRFGLLLRSAEATDLMRTFLKAEPRGLPGGPDVDAERHNRLEAALAALDEDGAHAEAWTWLSIAGAPSLSEAQRDRLDAAFQGLAFADVMARTPERTLCSQIMLTRRTLGGPLDENLIAQKLHDMALHCAFRHPAAFAVQDSSAASIAFSQVVETAAAAARAADADVAISRLALLCRVIAQAWPACAPALRTVLDAYAIQTPHAQGYPIWEALVELRRWR